MNAYEIFAKLGIDASKYYKGLGEAGKAGESFAGKMKDMLGTVAKVSTAAVSAAATGIGAIVKQSVSAYADYEQLVGGVETLFGESAKKVIADAEQAYKTAGMSMNEYMETSIQSAAALINSLDGDQAKAADLMNMSIVDMSDNVNKMGTTMEAVQNAYRGFSRGNFTMLDNLALGFAGTKEGMQELLDKAKELSGVEYDISSYADIVQAIHTVQDAMGITDTTKLEAEKTISGSISSAKSAWRNLITEMGKSDGDIKKAFENLSESIGVVYKNIEPRVMQTITNVGDIISEAAPEISRAISTLIPKLVPTLMTSGASLVSSLAKGFAQAIPSLLDAGISIMAQINNALRGDGDSTGVLKDIAKDILARIPTIFRFGRRILEAIADDILNVDYGKLAENIQKVFSSAINNITSLVKGIDWYKVGENIADFVNHIDWQKVANEIFNLLAAAIKGLSNIAVSFFANADLGNIMVGIGLLAGKSLLGGVGDFFKGSEGMSLTQSVGESWSGAFMAGIKAFGLGWAIGTWLRDNITIGGKTIGEWVDVGTEKLFGDPEEKAEQEWSVGDTIKDEKGREIIMYNDDGTHTAAYDAYIRKQAATQYEAWKNFDIEEYRRQNNFPGYAEGGRVTKPTIAMVGEKEPETIIPDSKLEKIGTTTNYITINVEGYNIQNDEEFTELLSRKLSELSVRQQRAVGGAGW